MYSPCAPSTYAKKASKMLVEPLSRADTPTQPPAPLSAVRPAHEVSKTLGKNTAPSASSLLHLICADDITTPMHRTT